MGRACPWVSTHLVLAKVNQRISSAVPLGTPICLKTREPVSPVVAVGDDLF